MKGAWSTGDYTDDTETRSIRLWKQPRENDMKLQPIRKEKLPRRNDKCPCGSGKKAKKCCLPSIRAFAALPQSVREQIVVARILSRPNTITVNGGTVATEVGIAVPVESNEIVVANNPGVAPCES
jgi:hypothetical protein